MHVNSIFQPTHDRHPYVIFELIELGFLTKSPKLTTNLSTPNIKESYLACQHPLHFPRRSPAPFLIPEWNHKKSGTYIFLRIRIPGLAFRPVITC